MPMFTYRVTKTVLVAVEHYSEEYARVAARQEVQQGEYNQALRQAEPKLELIDQR